MTSHSITASARARERDFENSMAKSRRAERANPFPSAIKNGPVYGAFLMAVELARKVLDAYGDIAFLRVS
jgi:hypothetical protein